MEKISQETTIDGYIEWLEKIGFSYKKRNDNFLLLKKNSISLFMAKMVSENLLFMLAFDIRDEIEELDIYKKINEVNQKILTGCLVFDQENAVVTYSFSLVKPYGMGFVGFKNFIDYNLSMVGYMLDELKLSEITK